MKNIILSKDGRQITLATEGFEYIFNKKLINITPPKTSDTWSEGASTTMILDLLKAERKRNIDGYIADGFGTGDTSATAVGKKDDILYLAEHGGVVNIVNDGITTTGNFEKISIKEINQDEGTTTLFSVKMTVVIGDNL